MPKPTVFISYAHTDKEWLEELVSQLNALGGAVTLEPWDDREIRHGDDWYARIKAALNRARFAVCLVTKAFLSSDFINKEEIPALLERRDTEGLEILPILISSCPWETHPWLTRLQCKPSDGKYVAVDYCDRNARDEFFKEIALDIHQRAAAEKAPLRPPSARIPDADLEAILGDQPHAFGRIEQTELLDRAWEQEETRVVAFFSWAGTGKTTVLREWATTMAGEEYRGAGAVFAWSFSNQDRRDPETSADEFMVKALSRFEDAAPEQGTPWEKGDRLARLVAKRRGLVLLDGLEPLQYASGSLKDPGILALLRRITRESGGMCVITTRRKLVDFDEQDFRGVVVQQNLEEITPRAGRALLRSRDIAGGDAALEAVVSDFGCQALAVNLLASYLHVIGQPDIAAVANMQPFPMSGANSHGRRVLAALEAHLEGSAELELLRVISLFRWPVGTDALRLILASPSIPGVTEHLGTLESWSLLDVVDRLRRYRLLERIETTKKFDTHPVVRLHFAEQLVRQYPDSWCEGHRRLHQWLAEDSSAVPSSLHEEFTRIFAAIEHGCLAREYAASYDLYRERVRAVCEAGRVRQPAIGSELATLAGFFDERWTVPVKELPEEARSDLLRRTAECLQALGRVGEAKPPAELCFQADEARRDAFRASSSAEALSTISLVLGDLREARLYAERSVYHAEHAETDGHTIYALARWGDIIS